MANTQTAGEPARTGRTGERYEKRRNELIDIAAQVFAEQGYHATSIDDLVRATNLQRGGLYHYIGGKKDLLLSIHERFIEPLLEETQGVLATDDAADVKLRKVAHVLMHTIDRYSGPVTVFLHEWRVIRNDPAWEQIRLVRRNFERTVEQIIEEGRDQGLFAFKDSRLAVLAFLGMLNYSHQWFQPDGRVPPDDIADYFCDIFLEGIYARGAAK